MVGKRRFFYLVETATHEVEASAQDERFIPVIADERGFGRGQVPAVQGCAYRRGAFGTG